MSAARNLSKMINKENYITHSGHSSVSGLDMPTETSMVGMITSFSMTTDSDWRATNRWLICDGSAISRTTYSDLFSVVSTTWGVGDGSSTFNLPDLRGAFLRGSGTGTINGRNKAGGSVGLFTEDQFETHKHGSGNINYGQDVWVATRNFTVSGGTLYFNTSDPKSPARHGSETFPYNASVQFCIKY